MANRSHRSRIGSKSGLLGGQRLERDIFTVRVKKLSTLRTIGRARVVSISLRVCGARGARAAHELKEYFIVILWCSCVYYSYVLAKCGSLTTAICLFSNSGVKNGQKFSKIHSPTRNLVIQFQKSALRGNQEYFINLWDVFC